MKKSYHHGDLKKFIIKQTVDLIQEKQEVNFSLREISHLLGVSHTAVYRHFSSKKELLSHIAEDGLILLAEIFQLIIATKKSNKILLFEMAQSYIEFALTNPGYYRAMFHQELRFDGGQRVELDEAGEFALKHLVFLLETGIDDRTFIKIDSKLAARSIWSSLHGFCLLYLDGQFKEVDSSKESLRVASEQHVRFILGQLQNKS